MAENHDPRPPASTRPDQALPPGAPAAAAREYLPFLDVTRILAVVGVIAIHVIGGAVSGGTAGIGLIALDMALIAAVPVFIMMAGALSLDPRAHRHGPGVFLRRRAARILPALIVWSVFYVVAIRMVVGGQEITAQDVLQMAVDGDAYTHLYFLWVVAGLYVTAPVLAAFLAPAEGRRAWIVGLMACAWTVAVMAAGQLENIGDLEHAPVSGGAMTYFLLYLGYFVLGRAMLVRPIPRWAAVLGLASVPVLVGVVTALYGLRSAQADAGGIGPFVAMLAPSYVSLPVVLYAVVLMASICALCREWRVPERTARVLRTLGNATFGVFLVHFAVLAVLRAIPALAPFETGPMLVCFAVTAVVSSAISIIGARIPGLRRIL